MHGYTCLPRWRTILAITRDDVLKALADVTVDAAGTTLPGSGRLSQVVVDRTTG